MCWPYGMFISYVSDLESEETDLFHYYSEVLEPEAAMDTPHRRTLRLNLPMNHHSLLTNQCLNQPTNR